MSDWVDSMVAMLFVDHGGHRKHAEYIHGYRYVNEEVGGGIGRG